MKISRNSPCPCGSGKKYKHCCLSLEGIVDTGENAFIRYSQLMSTVKLKLDDFYKAEIRKVRKPLQDRFFRICTTNNLPPEQESLLSDWLWFDATDAEGMTFGREYMRDHGPFLEEPLRECLQGLSASFLSLYEVYGMENGSLRLKDYLTGQDQLVLLKEPLDMEIGENRPFMLGRLVDLPLGQLFSGVVLLLKNDDGQAKFIRQHINYLQRLRGGQDLSLLMKQNGEILFGLFDRASHKALLGLNDIRVVRDQQKIQTLLDGLPDLQEFASVHTTAGITWYEMRESLGSARLGVNSEYVVGYADIIDDILRMEGLLNTYIPNNSWNIINNLLLFQAPPAEFNDFWYMVVKEQETERWLKTEHRELENRTPGQILGEEKGRERLLSMLDLFAAQASGNEFSADLIDYMRQRISV